MRSKRKDFQNTSEKSKVQYSMLFVSQGLDRERGSEKGERRVITYREGMREHGGSDLLFHYTPFCTVLIFAMFM